MIEKLFPDSFLKNRNWAYLWINSVKFYTVFVIVCQVEGYQNILRLNFRPLTFTSYKPFLRNKRRSRSSLRDLFFALFLKKNVIFEEKYYLVTLYYLTEFHSLGAFTLGNICIISACQPGCFAINVEINLVFLIKPFYLDDQKVRQKFKYFEKEKNF